MEGARSSVGDCWKGLRMRSTLKCLQNSEVVGVQRMPKVSEVGVGKTPRCFRSGKTGHPLTITPIPVREPSVMTHTGSFLLKSTGFNIGDRLNALKAFIQ